MQRTTEIYSRQTKSPAPGFRQRLRSNVGQAVCPALFGALLAGSWYLFAQESETPTFHVDVDMVLLSVTVTDLEGRYVDNLTKSDFRILENGLEQKIRTFTNPPHDASQGARNDPATPGANV